MLHVFRFTLPIILLCFATRSRASGQDLEILSNYLAQSTSTTEPLTLSEFRSAVSSLTDEFNFICGDLFCEGEFSEIVPVNFDCVINKESKQVSLCQWLFLAFQNDIDVETGLLVRREKIFRCDVPFGGDLKLFREFLAAATVTVQGSESRNHFNTVIPGSLGRTIYRVLSSCLN